MSTDPTVTLLPLVVSAPLTASTQADIKEAHATASNTPSTQEGAVDKSTSIIHTIKSIKDFTSDLLNPDRKLTSRKTVALVDIDETALMSAYALGSADFRKMVKSNPKFHDRVTYLVARTIPVKPVEPETCDAIEKLIKAGVEIYGFTARQRNKWYETEIQHIDSLTIAQLKSIGIQFSQMERVSSLTKDNPHYFQGVIFANEDEKGKYLEKVLKPIAEKLKSEELEIAFLDDKKPQAESVAKVLAKLGITGRCYWYNPPKDPFSPLVAQFQLEQLLKNKRIVTDEEAAKEIGTMTMPESIEKSVSKWFTDAQVNKVLQSCSLYKDTFKK